MNTEPRVTTKKRSVPASYWLGALINYAPSFSGVVTNILQG